MVRTAAELLDRVGPTRWTAARAPARSRSTVVDRFLLERIHGPFRDTPIRFQLWDDTACGVAPAAAAATVVIRNRFALFHLLVDPEMAFGDGYTCGAIEVHGDLFAVLDAAYRAFPNRPFDPSRRRRGGDIVFARANIQHHYDVGNDFYRLWLDDEMVYTCAYFPDPEVTLEQAQRAKLDYVCRKLRLQPGERVIEAGCGWGSLALHMAARYGVSVKAYNISREQIAYAREQADRLGLGDRVEFIEDDYRNIQGACDAFVSVGMVEHVGAGQLGGLGAVIDRVLDRQSGRGLLHFIGRNAPRELSAWIRRRIFPGGHIPTLAEVTEAVCEPWDLAVLDVENLRLHYARTLEHWLRRFENAVPEVTARYSEAFARAWRLYLAGSVTGFRTGTLQLFQVTFARGASSEVPWTREHLYASAETMA